MKKFLLLGAAMPALILTGCGDGWEAKLYEGFPYGNSRTAGHGIVYVRANMMPEKGPVVDAPELFEAPEPPLEDVPMVVEDVPLPEEDQGTIDKLINSGEKFFRKMQQK